MYKRQAYADFNDMMDLFEDLLSGAAMEILGTYEVDWQGEHISLAPGWPRLTMAEAVKKHLGIDFMAIEGDAEAVAAAKACLLYTSISQRKTKMFTKRTQFSIEICTEMYYYVKRKIGEYCI